MKRMFALLAGAALLLALNNTQSLADDKGKEITLKGNAECAKCTLHEGDACKTVIQTKKDGKTETYYLVENDVSKAFNEDVCETAKPVVAKGTVKEVDGKKQLTLTKIELAKK